ncbi:eCIS core domain-containing protein [Gaoshiqia sp. Z1-71]|uniref:eCIS core domain-containing protein n=1 Tax=Gaoshiqia hydrogeniformans TaxID=3290090 RepID=UPI003BF88D82
MKRWRDRRSSPFFNARSISGFFGLQTKLSVGEPDDKYEVEADAVADKVVNRSESPAPHFFDTGNPNPVQRLSAGPVLENPLAETISPLVQKQPDETEEQLQKQFGDIQKQEEEEEIAQMQALGEEEEIQAQQGQGVEGPEEDKFTEGQVEEEEEVQAKPNGGVMASPSTEHKLKNSGRNGNKMDTATRHEMERGFGADFSKVNIHTDSKAVQLSKELGAQAFTHKNDIYFNEGKYRPDSNEGKHLLAHELTHTIQQTGAIPVNLQFTIGDGHDLTAARFSGDAVLEACLDNEQLLRVGDSGPAVSLVQQALVDAGFPLPRFGVDGIFGNETRSALRDFQRASTLSADGILGPNTMSALDALFSGGAPALPPPIPVVPPPVNPPAITSETIKSAPDGSPDTRQVVGVGERVRFTADTSGTWSVSDGRIIGLDTGANVVWEAPPVAAAPTITLTTPGGTRVVPFTVIAPDALSMVVATRDAIPAGTAGACMITDVTVNPLNVNFGRTQWLEVPGPATNVSGYFNQFAAATIFHNPNPDYLPFNDNNTGLRDHAAWEEVPPPFSFGTFEWVIPNRYKIDGESDAQGRVFTNTVQAFTMFPGGTMMITKAGAFVIRFINNTVISV